MRRGVRAAASSRSASCSAAQLAHLGADGDAGVGPGRFAPAAGPLRPGRPARRCRAASGLPAALSAPRCTESAGSTCSSEPTGGQPCPAVCRGDDGEQRMGELRTASRDLRVPPVAVAARPARSRKRASNAEVGSSSRRARCGAARRSRRRTASRVQDRISAVCRVPSASTAKLGTPRLSSATVRASKGSMPAAACWVTGISASSRSLGHRSDRSVQVCVVDTVDDQHRQRAHSTQVGAGHPHLGQRPAFLSRRHPHPGPAGLGQLPLEFVGVHRLGRASTSLVKALRAGPPSAIRSIRQVGVDVEVAVARLVGAAAGGRDAGADQRDHQLARQPAGRPPRRATPPRPPTPPACHRRPGPGPPRTTRTSCRPGCPASTGARRCPPIRRNPCAATRNRAR